MADDALSTLVSAELSKRGVRADDRLSAICGLFKDRCDTLVALADWAAAFYNEVTPQADDMAKHITPAVLPALDALAAKLSTVTDWTTAQVSVAFKEVLTEQGLKMPQLAMPVRVLVMGTPQTPSVDAVLWLCGKEKVLARLTKR
jgi:glutamyl-tRNA synthetase